MPSAFEKITWNKLENLENAWPFLPGYVPPIDLGTTTETIAQVDPGEWVYFADFVVSLGQRVAPPGVGVFVNKLWANQELIFDRASSFSKPGVSYSFYDGAEDQGVVYRGVNYRGLMTLVFRDFNVKDYGNRIPAITAELIDGTAENPAHNIAGTIYSKYPLVAPIAEYHSEADSLYRAFHLTGGNVIGTRLYVERIRASTKTQSSFVPLIDYTYGQNYEDADVIRDTQMTFLPELNMSVGQAGDVENEKRLHDLGNGVTVFTYNSGVAWQGCLSFKVTAGAYSDWFVVGASELTGALQILVIKGQMLHAAWAGTAADNVRCLTIGKSRDGSTDVYVTTDDQVERVSVGSSGSAGGFTSAVAREVVYSAAVGEVVRQCWYDPLSGVLFVLSVASGAATLQGLDASGAVVMTTGTFTPPAATSLRVRTEEASANIANGTLIIKQDGAPTLTTDTVTFVNLVTGYTADFVVPNNETTTDDNLPIFWDSVSQVIYSNLARYIAIGVFPDPDDDPDRYTAATVMRSYAVFAGYDTADVFTTGMDDMYLDGYVLGDQSSLAQLSSAVGQLYGFNWSEGAGQISYKANYVDGELSVDLTVPEDRLARLAENSGDIFAVMRSSDNNYPAILSLTYFDGANDYKRGFQIVSRNGDPVGTMDSDQPLHLSLPLTINGDYALELLYDALYRAWAKNAYSLRLPSDFIPLDAGDVIEFTAYSATFQGVITQTRINADNTVSLSLEEVATDTYPVQVETQPTVVAPTKAAMPVRTVILDIPSRNDGQNAGNLLNLLVLMAGYAPGRFNGAVLEMTDAGNPTDWKTTAVISRDQEAYIGTLTAEFDTWLYPFETDTLNSIYFSRDTLPVELFSNADETALDNGANLVAVGEGSEVELIQFGNVEHIGGDIYRLYNLRRGRFGTEVFQDLRTTGTPISLLERAVLVNYSYDDYEGNVQFLYRAHSPTQPMWQVDTQRYVPMGNSRKPYAPVYIRAYRDTETSDIVITWVRRARFENSPPEDFTTPGVLDELTEEYEVHIPSLVDDEVRIIKVNDFQNATYTIDAQFDDGRAGDETELTFNVYQSSPETVGIGFTVPQVLTLYPVGAALIGARIHAGGLNTTNVVLEANPAVHITAHMAGGGTVTTFMSPTPVRLGADMAAGGAVTTNIRPPVKLAAVMDGGGVMETNLTEPLVDPADFPDMMHWFDPSNVGTMTKTGNLVDAMADLSGNSRTATGSGWRPLHGVDTINSLPVLTYDTSEILNTDWDTTTDEFTSMFILQTTQTTDNANWYASPFIMGRDAGGIQNDFGIFLKDGYIGMQVRDSAPVALSTFRVNDNVPHVITFRRDASGVLDCWIDGAHNFTTTINANTINDLFTIGLGGNGFPSFVGKLGEIVNYKAAMSETDILALQTYAAAKWGIDDTDYVTGSPRRYWRVMLQTNNGDTDFIVVGELEFSEVNGTAMDGSDETGSGLGTPSHSTSAGSGNDSLYAFDNSYTTSGSSASNRYWASASGSIVNQWLAWDFGTGNDKTIIEVRMLCDRDAARAPQNIVIQSSPDGTEWGNEWEVSPQTGWTVGEWRTFAKP